MFLKSQHTVKYYQLNVLKCMHNVNNADYGMSTGHTARAMGQHTYSLIQEPHCAAAPLLAVSVPMLLKPVDWPSDCVPQDSVTAAGSWATST